MVKVGKGQCVRQRSIILSELRDNLYHAYVSGTLRYLEHKELTEYIRDVLSWDSIIGVKQLSIFDTLPDEPFGNEKPNLKHMTDE